VYLNIKTLVIKLASNTVHEQLFFILVLGYSMEPQTLLDHILQSYLDKNVVPIQLSAQVYYSTFLNTMQSFCDLEEYSIDIAGIIMVHIHSTYAKGFCAHYPSHGQARKCFALTQRHILTNKLQALINPKTKVSNILNILRISQQGGEQFYQTPPATPAFPSLAEQTINSYSRSGDNATNSTAKSEDLECFGCRGPHPWSKHDNGKWMVICPNASKPCIPDYAKLAISQFQTHKKKQA
jgi:hypothetical protein